MSEAAETIALGALVHILSDETRARRLLDMTGLGVDELRARAGEPALLAAVLGFLEAHEPDLIECAASLSLSPADLVRARERLDPREHYES